MNPFCAVFGHDWCWGPTINLPRVWHCRRCGKQKQP